MTQPFTFIDLFAGIGGFHKALHDNGGECIGFSEIAKDAIATYCDNFQMDPSLNLGDITKIEALPQHDLLTAGVPCQSWSNAGKRLGFHDTRGLLWNDTLYLLQQAKPKAFIFENVKGLAEPRNKEALDFILASIRGAGYHADYYLINSYTYGLPQSRERIYIIGFQDEQFFKKFRLLPPPLMQTSLAEVLGIPQQATNKRYSELKDHFIFSDTRNGSATIHSWDITPTTQRQKDICMLLLKNRRKREYGLLDGNPLSLEQLQQLDSRIAQSDINELVKIGILKAEDYRFTVEPHTTSVLQDDEQVLLEAFGQEIQYDVVRANKALKIKKVNTKKVLASLKEKGIVRCTETRYDFKNRKNSAGINGVGRVFLTSAATFPTLVASDTSDFVATVHINAASPLEQKEKFISEIYSKQAFRQITKEEACHLQGFPRDFTLPFDSRARWMKLIGNSVTVPVIDALCKAVINTGVFR